ncbi:YciI family protein [Musicola keenii]|uniref:YciI family protein n=1 Tax=Musicola keenii TaxID=2884250 RepID=UPI001786DA6C|nr:hypothetical protein [Musicola keenii]
MLHAITLEYTSPKYEFEKHMDAHKKWLADNIRGGHIIFAGPLENGTGGFILASGINAAEIGMLLSDDPFVIFKLVKIDIKTIEPAICSGSFYSEWASGATFL